MSGAQGFEQERRNLLCRVSRRAEQTDAPDPELYAMLALAFDRRSKLSQKAENHLHRMIAAEFVLVTNTQDYPEFDIAWRAVRQMVQPEVWAYQKAGDDMRDLSPLRRAALSDVLTLQERVGLE